MLDDNWELINGPDAHKIEALNATNTVNVIEALITYIIHYESKGCPSKNVLCELHRTGTLFLLSEPGSFRVKEVYVAGPTGAVIHQPPTHTSVEEHIDEFFQTLGEMWHRSDALDIAAYA